MTAGALERVKHMLQASFSPILNSFFNSVRLVAIPENDGLRYGTVVVLKHAISLVKSRGNSILSSYPSLDVRI